MDSDGQETAALGSVERIVLVRATNLGDIIVATPLLRALRAAYPRTDLALIGRAEDRPLGARYGRYIDRVIAAPGFPGFRDQLTDARETVAFLARMQAERFDLALQVTGSGVFSNPFTKLLGARVTAGWVRPSDHPRFMGLDVHAVYQPGRHQVELMHDLLAALGVPACGSRLEFPVSHRDQAELTRVLRARGVSDGVPLIGVHPGARAVRRRWPAERYGAVAGRLARHLGGVVVVTGTAGEASTTGAVVDAVRGPAVDLTGQLSLGGLGALIGRLALLLVNDTGPSHIAYALGTPSVTIFGPSLPEEWGPLDREGHRVVVAPDGQVAGVATAEVLAAAEALLADRAADEALHRLAGDAVRDMRQTAET